MADGAIETAGATDLPTVVSKDNAQEVGNAVLDTPALEVPLPGDSELVVEKSEVETAEPEDILDKAEGGSKLSHPLTLSWSFGYNSQLPVHNVSEGNRKMIFYSSAHSGILLDCKTNQQCLLQGHSNTISCTAVSLDRRWLVTGDYGPDCMLTIWDSFSGIPVRNIFTNMGDGIVAVTMSPDAQYIATITMAEEQVVSVWEWTLEADAPVCYIALGEDYSLQTFIMFHPNDPHQLISNSEDMVVFYYWEGNDIKVDSHPILDKEFHRPLGTYSQSVLVPNTSLGLTGTSEGNGVVWATVDGSVEGPHIKRALKLLKMHTCAITVVTYVMDMVVTGDVNGKIQFFNSELMLLNWYDDCSRFGPLSSISFSYDPKLSKLKQKIHKGKRFSDVNLGEHRFPDESTKPALPFLVPDFVISTSSASIAHVTANGSCVESVLSEHDAAVNALAAHPFLPRLLVGSYSGRLKLWDYEKKVVLSRREITEPNYLHCVNFDPKAEYIGVGYTNGVLQVLDSLTLSDVGKLFRYSRDAITHIVFSHDSCYMATADLDMCVSVYVAQPSDPDNPWAFLAKHRSHYMTIKDLMFGVRLDSDSPSLLSLGKDRTLVEYDLGSSSKDNLVLLSVDRIEQSAIPMVMTWYPPLVKESFIITANDKYKLKLYNSTTKMCRRTLLGPVYGSPLRKILILPSSSANSSKGKIEDRRYLVYCTTSKVGLVLLPHDGNPHNSKCLVAHPGKVSNLVCSYDGKYVFSAGGEDFAINMWTVNTDALEAASLLGGEDLEPFYAMLDGGRSGEFFSELEEFFYYAQIRSQGPDVTCRREISTTISIESIPSVMRAIGFYPSEQEVEAMINEVKFSKYEATKQCVKTIDLGDFIRLYVNHRPVFGLSPRQIGGAFKILGEKTEGEWHWEVLRSELLALLQERGEHLTETDMVEYLVTLLGYSDNPEVEGSFTDDAIVALKQIPEKISARVFAEDIVGLATDRPKQPQQEQQDQHQQEQQQQPQQQEDQQQPHLIE